MGVFGGTKDFSSGDDLGVVPFKIRASLIGTGDAFAELPCGVDRPLPVPEIFASNDEEYTSGFVKLRKRSSNINVETSCPARRGSAFPIRIVAH